MEAYKHFKLKAVPFDSNPSPRFYFPAPAHGEALATAQYAVHSGKTCCAILGESGSGKTLIGRLLADFANPRFPVLWVPGLGQPADRTELTVCLPGTLNGGNLSRRRPHEATLDEWRRSKAARAGRTLIIVDNADRLRFRCWEELLGLIMRDFRPIKPSTIVLLGLPRLLDRLTSPSLQRLWRRLFRLSRLEALSRENVEAYVRHRLGVAGSRYTPFNTQALDLIHRFSGGNPALINQICDNALVEAYGDDRTSIGARQIVSTVHAITGPLNQPRELGQPSSRQIEASKRAEELAEPVRESRLTARLREITADWDNPDTLADEGHLLTSSDDSDDRLALAPAQSAAADFMQQAGALISGNGQQVVSAHQANGDRATGAPRLVERLRVLEVSISDALTRVRQARAERRDAKPVSAVEVARAGDPAYASAAHDDDTTS
jgi:type II secretory pathway predicted ATPase ExeA